MFWSSCGTFVSVSPRFPAGKTELVSCHIRIEEGHLHN